MRLQNQTINAAASHAEIVGNAIQFFTIAALAVFSILAVFNTAAGMI